MTRNKTKPEIKDFFRQFIGLESYSNFAYNLLLILILVILSKKLQDILHQSKNNDIDIRDQKNTIEEKEGAKEDIYHTLPAGTSPFRLQTIPPDKIKPDKAVSQSEQPQEHLKDQQKRNKPIKDSTQQTADKKNTVRNSEIEEKNKKNSPAKNKSEAKAFKKKKKRRPLDWSNLKI